jgi:hypothetical protein
VFAKNNLSKEKSVKQALKEVIENGESVIRAAVNYNIERTALLRKVIIVINLFFNIMSNETFPITGAIKSSF